MVSETASAVVAINLSNVLKTYLFWTILLTTTIIVALTIGGKALGKNYAINKNNIIVFKIAKVLAHFFKEK